MKTRHSILICLTVLAATALAGCAGTRPAAEQVAVGSDAARYVAAVETAAVKHGTEVYWINPPKDDDKKKDR